VTAITVVPRPLPSLERVIDQLTDGTPILIRPIQPSDKGLLSAGLERLSQETIRRRFLAPKSRFSEKELRYLTEIDGSEHFAVVSVLADDPQELAGVGRFVRLADDPTSAEAAIVVADCHQEKGLGTLLAFALADQARNLGIHRFTATLLGENLAAHKLMRKLTDRLVESIHQDGVHELSAELGLAA
jgi:RimJ/RimL family protein N-acetyltransferase